MGHREEVLRFLEKIAPKSASNADIASHTRIKPHAQVFQITRLLMDQGMIDGRRAGHEWVFSARNGAVNTTTPAKRRATDTKTVTTENPIGPVAFEALCQKVMSEEFRIDLRPGQVEGVPKRFDLLSEDGRIVGDAKYYTAVNGTSLPPAKFATIAEYVWLLEKTKAEKQFLVFGNDRRVPEWWLDRYGHMLESVTFYFLSDAGRLHELT